MIARKPFLYYLADTPTGKAYYRDNAGVIVTTTITTAGSAINVSLPNAPGNWLDATFSVERNLTYFALNRSYSDSQEFVMDTKEMIEELILLGVGTETPLTLVVFKRNIEPQTGEPEYLLYYKGDVDLINTNVTAFETLNVNLMEGGLAKLFKRFENTLLEIPIDGSLPEHFKINADGQLVKDRFFYEILNVSSSNFNANFLPAVFINNEGDNYGIVRNETVSLKVVGNDADMLVEGDYLIYSTSPINVRIKGSITLKNGSSVGNEFKLSARNQFIGPSRVIIPTTFIHQKSTIQFDQVIPLAAYEKLFLFFVFFGDGLPGNDVQEIVTGNFSLEIVTKPHDSRIWAVTFYDLFKLAVRKICDLGSDSLQTFTYEGESTLLSQNLNLSITSGDAIRASNDPTYQSFYSLNENSEVGFGPVIKTTIKNIFKAATVQLMTSLGIDYSGAQEVLFIETLRTVFNSSAVDFSLGEVSKLRWSFAAELMYSGVKIGYAPQSYDQKAGKYEPNTTLEMSLPVKFNEPKVLDLISPFRGDSTGIERLRATLEAVSTSITRNDSDSSVFIIDTDRSKFIYDYFRALFNSTNSDPDDDTNTNIHFAADQLYQRLDHPITDGDYFKINKDWGIFVFSEAGYSATESTTIVIDAVINSVNRPPSAPVDTLTIRYWVNGVVVKTYVTSVSGINTPVVINDTFSQGYAVSDCIYISLETSTTCEAQINTASLAIGSYVTMSGVNVPVLGGTPQKLLSLPNITPTSEPYDINSKVQCGYQYFTYNSLAYGNNFNIQLGVNGYRQGSADPFIFNIYINGQQVVNYISVNGTVPRTQFAQAGALINRNFQLNDIVFVTGSRVVPGTSSTLIQLITSTLTFTSTSVLCYSLFREQYDSLTGIPNYATDSFGNFRTDLPGSPYNIRLSPKTLYDKCKPLIESGFLDQVTGQATGATLSKNPYLSRTIGGVTITENADEDILTGNRLFYPIKIFFDTEVLYGFADIMAMSVNKHIHLSVGGNDLYFFPMKMSQKPALNESQSWEGLLSPMTSLNTLAHLTSFKVPDMPNNSIFYSRFSPIQWVPYNRSIEDKYHTKQRDEFLFREQITLWPQRNNYAAPIQIGDFLTPQFITNGLDPVSYKVFTCCGVLYRGPQNLNTVASNAVIAPKTLWQYLIDTSDWEPGNYYIVIYAALTPILISDSLTVGTYEQMEGSVYVEASHRHNSQDFIFDGVSPYVIHKRFWGGYDNRFIQKFIAKEYVDQLNDVTMLNGIPYEITKFFLGRDWGTPDYEPKKFTAYMLMNKTKIEGEGFSLNPGADWEVVTANGAPMKLQSIEIRPSTNKTGVIVTAGQIDRDSSLIVTINPESMGPNITNQSGTTDTDIIEIITN